MESIRQQLLQAELKRIENEAEAKSFAAMNQADALLAGHQLCQRINAIEPQIDEFEAVVTYYSTNTAEVSIFPHGNSDLFVRRCQDLGLTLEVMNPSFYGHHEVTIDGIKGVHVFLESRCLPLINTPERIAA